MESRWQTDGSRTKKQEKRARPKLRSFKSKKSKWTVKADKYFKGEGAYYSGGSRPNQSKTFKEAHELATKK